MTDILHIENDYGQGHADARYPVHADRSRRPYLAAAILKAMNNAIDKRTVSAVAGEEGGRLLDARACMSRSIERRRHFLQRARIVIGLMQIA
jgi:hypothetical protein